MSNNGNGAEANAAQEAFLRAKSATAGAKATLPVAIRTLAELRVHTDEFVKLLREYAVNLGE